MVELRDPPPSGGIKSSSSRSDREASCPGGGAVSPASVKEERACAGGPGASAGFVWGDKEELRSWRRNE
ncbi:hypothetical protein SRHO_G00030580 [Serrasalmus rhombeus]